ncbi:MAG: alkaline phosphatase [Candidatus Azotimanducaceae bacterium]
MLRFAVVFFLLAPLISNAKNVVLFLGDGMGVSTVTSARIFEGQQQGKLGEEHSLSFEEFENLALIKTYNTDAQVPDSAGTISAILTGQKTRAGVSGVNASVERGNCQDSLTNQLPTILEMAEQRGMRSGVVSTARITHATPAGAYAHYIERNWEDNDDLSEDAVTYGCKDIARQLVEFKHGDGVDIILGGGRANFLPQYEPDPEYESRSGKRTDKRNLINEWIEDKKNRSYVWSLEGLRSLNLRKSHQILGLFESSHMHFEADRLKDQAGEPALSEMTEFALNALDHKNKTGFFLLIEAGRIDHGHHAGNAYRAITDTVELSKAVLIALNMVDLSETLILVTSDHSHTLTISGYQARGNPILGLARAGGHDVPDALGKPYTTLSYANGPGYLKEIPDLSKVDTKSIDYRQLSTRPMYMETHAGEDVAAYATGLASDMVRGTMEQNELFNVMYKALFSN